MYAHRLARRSVARLFPACLAAFGLALSWSSGAGADEIVKKLQGASDRMELTVNSSRILTVEGKVPRTQVNDPSVLTVTPLSPNEIQISAVKPGVTQVNLWDEQGKIYTVDVMVFGDVQELEVIIRRLFPHSAVKAIRTTNSLVLTGFVDQPNNANIIMKLAEDYAPKVVSNLAVGGVQQIVLHVQVMEVSRNKLRALGFDFADINGNDFVISSVSGLLNAAGTQAGTATGTGGDTVRFGVVTNGNSFFGFLKALRQYDLMKILAEPTLVTISGRPASFNVGGEFPVLVPAGLGTVSIEYKKFGTQVDFMPLVLGNGNIRLEVRPRISEIDSTRNVVINDLVIPGLRVREVETGVEMKAGQTLAIAGLVQNRKEAQNKGLPVLADMPWVGAAFRSVQEINNEIELLILVRPELADALDPHEVPHCLPGMATDSPNDTQLYWKGLLEVPSCNGCGLIDCPHCHGAGAAQGEAVQPGSGAQPLPTPNGASLRPRPTGTKTASGQVRMAAAGAKASPAYVPAGPVNQAKPNNPANQNPLTAPAGEKNQAGAPGMVGPLGYDVLD